MVVDMELQQAKDAVLQLMKEKDKVESEMKALKEVLDSNHVGMDDALVDSEGYPRQDIDVFQVRHARHKIICLTNDHKALMKKIEEGLHKVHSLTGNQSQEIACETKEIEEPVQLEPFLKVGVVSPLSPAEEAGLRVNDLLLEFGSINYRNFRSLQDIGLLVKNSRQKVVNLKVKRGSSVLALTLIPHLWAGEGLVGCSVVPLETVER